MKMFRNVAIAVAGAALVSGAAITAAQAQAETPWCTGADLVISAHDMRSPTIASKAHWIRFAPAEGADCRIGGSLSNVRFLDANGEDMNVPLAGGQGEYSEALVGGNHEAAVYVSSQSHGPRVNPASIRFDLPGQGSLGDRVTVAWPSGLGAIVRIGNLMAPVS
ncbi:hypothetical protein ACFWNN_34405 [Lentzea sp. NPDC058450]|uniref:hypothetical protein n=1 Tax=Lentzea sp. NPDC058450 TaxID=3346505 RepID=UPI00364F8905